jgi:hypothetical protein
MATYFPDPSDEKREIPKLNMNCSYVTIQAPVLVSIQDF